MMGSVDDYNIVKNRIYKEEYYSVRDNGAVIRHQRKDRRIRKDDNVWTFGRFNKNTGYMDFCGERVHRIVATAFHGPAPSDQHVVDHIDTNRCNNRPENLRWLTKLENILCNEITRKKVELICGSIEAFLNNPQLLYGYETEDKNFSWMKNVTKEEAQNCLANWSHWAKTVKPDSNYKREDKHVNEDIFKPLNINIDAANRPKVKGQNIQSEEASFEDNIVETDKSNTIETSQWLEQAFGHEEKKEDYYDDIWVQALTPFAKHLWDTPTEFPCCPSEVSEKGLVLYQENLKEGKLFSKNNYDSYYVLESGLVNNKNKLLILSTNFAGENVFGAYSVVCVVVDKGKYGHICLRRFGNKEDAEHFYNVGIGTEEMTEEDEIMWDT